MFIFVIQILRHFLTRRFEAFPSCFSFCYANSTCAVCIDPANAAASQANKEEVDSRSVFVGNVSFHHSFFPLLKNILDMLGLV